MKHKIIVLATKLAQQYGLNAFSYANLAKELGISKASIHHYFPSKDDLAIEILSIYSEAFFTAVSGIIEDSPINKLNDYVTLFESVSNSGNKICLCLMYGADFLSIPPPAKNLVREFYLKNENWLSKLFISAGDSDTMAKSKAKLLFSQLQGLLIRNRLVCLENTKPQTSSQLADILIGGQDLFGHNGNTSLKQIIGTLYLN